GLHAVGYVAYDAAPAFDPALAARRRAGMPLLWFGVFREPRDATAMLAAATPDAGSARWEPSASRAEWDAAIECARAAIGRGDFYQVNHTLRLRAPAPEDALALWARLRDAQGREAYHAFLDIGGAQVVSASPELFFRREGGRIETRPMKGTARRGRFPAEDDARRAALLASPKERAENVMIVDLLRNDLGRVAEVGSVRVPRLFDAERYPTVWQMTSTVEATLRADATLVAIFDALFPCGSVTGAPKVAATRFIAERECSARGVYCGAIGVVRPGGDCTFNVAIRTLVVYDGVAEYGAGGGITWDSAPAAEYDEALAKAAVLTTSAPTFELLETLLLEGGEYPRLERHVERAGASARYFGYADPRAAMRAALAAHASERGAAGRWRVRALADHDGRVRIESTALAGDAGDALLPVALARTPVSRDDRFLFHKTTHRATYDARRAQWPDAFDVLLWNEEGELTELTIGNVVLELDGERWTPPVECGLLAGTFRAELLERGAVRERVMRITDLARASRVWLVNGVRGWVPVVVARPDDPPTADDPGANR
ncbi:MAG TPA: aminodeoxychorismate synthase component I, partial [Gemmatimonadaceae bacterium]|nr:aminodeoxychorismate synthase component I [Gemmatimonadaceae bacterium]